VKKYENLIQLYRKKQLKFSGGESVLLGTANHTHGSPTDTLSSLRVATAISDLVKRQYRSAFASLQPKTSLKLALLVISSHIDKSAKSQAFRRLKMCGCSGIVQVLKQKVYLGMECAMRAIKAFTGNSTI
jgi:hypothetical protein